MLRSAPTLTIPGWLQRDCKDRQFYSRGYFFYKEQLYQAHAINDLLVSLFSETLTLDPLYEFAKKLNGVWTIIIVHSEGVHVINDIIRSTPIYYSKLQSSLVTDKVSLILDEESDLFRSKENLKLYLKSGSCYESETLFEKIHDTVAGEITIIAADIRRIPYWSLPLVNDRSFDNIASDLELSFESVLERMETFLNFHSEKTIFFPLSGGMDSRLLGYFLKKINIANKIVSYTYGKDPSCEEARISKLVASELGFTWEFIQYTDNDWQDLYVEIKQSLAEYDIAKSTPLFVDFLAVKSLVKKYGENLICIPGHLMDNLAGLTLPNYLKFSSPISFEFFYSQKYNLGVSGYHKLKKLNNYPTKLNTDEMFRWKSRLSTHIINSSNVYRYFGLDVYMPFLDKQLVEFFYSLPTKYRLERNLFRFYLNKFAYTDKYKSLLQIPIALNRTQSPFFKKYSFRSKLLFMIKFYAKSMCPNSILEYFDSINSIKNNPNVDYIGFYKLFNSEELEGIVDIKDYYGIVKNKKQSKYRYYYCELVGLWLSNLVFDLYKKKWLKNE